MHTEDHLAVLDYCVSSQNYFSNPPSLRSLQFLIAQVIYVQAASTQLGVLCLHPGNIFSTSNPWSLIRCNLPGNGNGAGDIQRCAALSGDFPLWWFEQLWLPRPRPVLCSLTVIHRHVATAATPCIPRDCFILNEDYICILIFDKHDAFLKAAGVWNHIVMFVPVILL